MGVIIPFPKNPPTCDQCRNFAVVNDGQTVCWALHQPIYSLEDAVECGVFSHV